MVNESICISFDDNSYLTALFGENDKHLQIIEQKLDVVTASRGNMLSLTGKPENVALANNILLNLYKKLEKGMEITMSDVEAAVRIVSHNKEKKNELFDEEIVIKTMRKHINPYSNNQKKYIKLLYGKEMVIAHGPAGTGKTYLAVAVGISLFLSNKVEKLILCRPAVEAGEKIGFLPGDMKDKVDPYMQPLYDALYDMMPADKIQKYIDTRIIEIAPLAFMRGRTLAHAFIILDEAQNATPAQMKMFLTRLGEGSRMVINGDLSQTDLPQNTLSGLKDATNRLKDVEEIGFCKFTGEDIVRHSLVTKIVEKYES